MDKGNFGSVDGDPPAAMRYRSMMEKIAHHLLMPIDIDHDSDFQENYGTPESELHCFTG